MPERNIAQTVVQVGEDGYMTQPSEWTREIAIALAEESGIGELTQSHWDVIEYLQQYFKENQKLPTIRSLKKTKVVPTKEFYQLFPEGPLKKATKIAGLPKPASCV